MGLIEKKKLQKRQNLLNAAYHLFKEKGSANTSIADICDYAGVAKGTFYLYFEDKEDISITLNREKLIELLKDTYKHTSPSFTDDFVENFILMSDYLITLYKEDPSILKVLNKTFSWKIDKKQLQSDDDPTFQAIRYALIRYAEKIGIDRDDLFIRLCNLINMQIGACYASMIDQFPASITRVHAQINIMIRNSLQA